MALDVTALGARALFRMPASALAWAVVEPADVLGSAGAELVERLNLAAGWAERFAVIDEVLLRVLAEPAAGDGRGAAGPGTGSGHPRARVSVAEVADEVGWSRRHLSEQFRAEFGLTPKVTARIMRFERATHLLQAARRLRPRRRGGHLRLQRPGPPHPRVADAGRHHTGRLAGGRAAPIRTRRRRPVGARLTS